MKTRIVAMLAIAIAVLTVLTVRPAVAGAPSQPLANALWTLRTIDDADFSNVVWWARNGASWPSSNASAYQRAERQILNLPPDDKSAVLAWLQGQSRSPLYAQGARDSDIGPRRPANMPGMAPTPTPDPYRLVSLASTSLGAVQGRIQVLGGFAAVKRDGTAAIVCVSFKNLSDRTAERVVFNYALLGRHGGVLGNLQLDRRGEFTTGVDINGWSDLSSWQSGIGHRGYGDNCTHVTQGAASVPFLNVSTVTYQVTRVEYRNGSVWP